VRDLGASVEITVRCGEREVLAVTTPRERPNVHIGDPVAVELPAAACVVLPS
jgi:putative spermidine/putrescine transport system ATP-binding protein